MREATTRLDLYSLSAIGKIQRKHGGAILFAKILPEAPILQRQHEQADEKMCIGLAAASLVLNNGTVFLGSGTTVHEQARAPHGRKNVTVITNSLPVINTLAGEDGIAVTYLGGMLRDSELPFIGHITEQALAEVRADKVFIGIRSINLEHGLTNEYPPDTVTDSAIFKAGKEIVVLANHTKFGRTAAVLFVPLDSIHTIVTGKETPNGFIKAMRSNNLKVIVA